MKTQNHVSRIVDCLLFCEIWDELGIILVSFSLAPWQEVVQD